MARKYNLNDKVTLDDTFDKMLNSHGLQRGYYTDLFSQKACITSPLTLYVETTGSDVNPGTQDKPFLTIQAALDSLKPFQIEAAVIIQVGAGTFDGFLLSETAISRRGSDSGTLTIQGTMGAPTLSTGTATGTATSVSANVINDTGQNWTTSEVIGKYVTNGANFAPIVSATATSLTSISTTAAGAYSIVEPKTIIINNAKLTSTTTGSNCIVVGSGVRFVTVSKIALTTSGASSGNAIVFNGSQGNPAVALTEVTTTIPTAGASSTAFNMATEGSVTLTRCVVDLQKASSIGFTMAAGMASTSFSYITGGNKSQACFVNSNTTSALLPSSVGSNNTYFNNLNSVLSQVTTAALPVDRWVVSGLYKDCNIVCNAIRGWVWLQDIHSNQPSFPIASSGNTTFILIDKDTRAQVFSNVPSGLATTDISVNAGTSTLTAMRALSPKVFPGTPNAWGSYVYE